ncbi:ABC transporter ATP-binding protein [Clostridium sp. AF18-27]|uniref:ABC transporter ATP-binding protein n=1 Tax=Enterocloster lavalensis TaxID=460384 RepID=UPI000E481329|nr:ABC transporter ATP-binding protein [Enterocloster lavalensis]MBS5604508.1 ABC transporter ATP-binding protein [Enterocloster asparagiformis]RHR53873.1 ABC transporter ATP-binding protein [Clostridium sp. AF18-27]
MILQLNGVNAFYGASQILFGVNVEVEEADSVCVLGRNGVGKSTMMKSIVGNLNPKEKSLVTGSIRYCGDELVGLPAYRIARKGIAYVPQGRHIFPTLTTRENLMMAERKAQTGENAWNLERVYELFPRLKERESFLGGRLSGGEQQMLTIARGLMQNPRLLLLDEITEGLAPIVVKELGEIIASLRRQNVTILLAEQNVNFALSASRKCYIMEKGHIAYSGLTAEIPKEVLNQYLGL